MSEDHIPQPVDRKLLTPGVLVLLILMAIGAVFVALRFLFGLSAVTNLDQQHPWGIWIGIDVATGVALAAGGFTTAALVHIFHRERFHALVRPALLTALLGYTFVGLGLMVDLGRPYNIWHPAHPAMWSGHSVLFEVGMCVMAYLTVLYLEFLPVVLERVQDPRPLPRLEFLRRPVSKVAEPLMRYHKPLMPWLIIAGVVLSCMHQSSLGSLNVIAPGKMHPLWWTPVLSVLFLLSAFAVGFPMVICESIYASWALKLKPEMNLLAPLSKYVPILLGIYLSAKLIDLNIRETWRYLLPANWSMESTMFSIEMVFGVVVPFFMILSRRIRRSPVGLVTAALLVVLGVALNRVNVFLVAFTPIYPERSYFPAIGEIAVTAGLIAALIFLYRLVVTYFPVISLPSKVEPA